jgi:hypothetical protein
MGMGSGGENTYFAKVLCQLQNKLCDISVGTVKPVDRDLRNLNGM